jgi:hypothetical protein
MIKIVAYQAKRQPEFIMDFGGPAKGPNGRREPQV